MSIHKCKRKLALCIASLFWAACDNDSSSAPDVTIPPESSDIPGSSEPPASSETAPAESSSSEAIEPASSSSSVNPDYPYTLGNDPSVHCKDSTYFIPSPCPSYSAKIHTVMEDFEENAPVYGIVQPVCNIPARNAPIFVCDNGAMYSQEGDFSLIGDTIKQCAPLRQIDGDKCPSAEDYYKKQAEEAEASTDYPYKLAQDTSINCKSTYTTKIIPATSYPDVLTNAEKWGNEEKYKCEDGNTYEWEALLKNEYGNAVRKDFQ